MVVRKSIGASDIAVHAPSPGLAVFSKGGLNPAGGNGVSGSAGFSGVEGAPVVTKAALFAAEGAAEATEAGRGADGAVDADAGALAGEALHPGLNARERQAQRNGVDLRFLSSRLPANIPG